MKISLMGYMGSGKSAVAAALADVLGCRLIDLDLMIEQKMQKPVSEIFSQQGQIRFRKVESEMLSEILETDDDFVLALGGGTPAYFDNLEKIRANTRTVYLRTGLNTLISRLQADSDKRPLISHIRYPDLPEFVAKHLFERRPFYEQSDYTIDTDGKTIVEIANQISLLLKT